MNKTGARRAAGPQTRLQLHLLNIIDKLHLDPDEIDQDTWPVSSSSQSSSVPLTPMETSGASTPRALSPTVFINDQDDDQVPIVDICRGGDLVVNVRRLGAATGTSDGLGSQHTMYTKVEPLARFRVSSVVLRMASHYVKEFLDSGVGGPTLAPTGLSLLWLHKDDSQTLNLLMENTPWTSCSVFGERKALATLLRILHFRLNSKDPIHTYWCDQGVMVALVAEFACALGCVIPLVPWMNLWLTKYVPGVHTYASDRSWDCRAEGHYVGIVSAFAMGDETAFRRWSMLCIRSGRDSPTFAGLGYVWSVINDDLQRRRRGYVKKLLAVLDEFWNLYSTDQSITAVALAHSVALGAFARAVQYRIGYSHQPPFVNMLWLQSLDDLMLVFQDIKQHIATVWDAFHAQHRFPKYITFKNPADVFLKEAEIVWATISGLDLQDYRPGVCQLLEVGGILDSKISEGTDYEIASRESDSAI
ncbi:hypothetical protein L211DRAFT_832646 [Terfezia boudieri ATCC MYA-4762]|uniref:Uncharacterized protein n=1 Tax=Terfezia boudieri ATCC MYA-4762 TaxID=1051890 RepID=A0A3N4M479_9PEZI|nr:hypothetical protein L211DRAFT_832646 [Terfezia boudieri ATCC MYA-4762]